MTRNILALLIILLDIFVSANLPSKPGFVWSQKTGRTSEKKGLEFCKLNKNAPGCKKSPGHNSNDPILADSRAVSEKQTGAKAASELIKIKSHHAKDDRFGLSKVEKDDTVASAIDDIQKDTERKHQKHASKNNKKHKKNDIGKSAQKTPRHHKKHPKQNKKNLVGNDGQSGLSKVESVDTAASAIDETQKDTEHQEHASKEHNKKDFEKSANKKYKHHKKHPKHKRKSRKGKYETEYYEKSAHKKHQKRHRKYSKDRRTRKLLEEYLKAAIRKKEEFSSIPHARLCKHYDDNLQRLLCQLQGREIPTTTSSGKGKLFIGMIYDV